MTTKILTLYIIVALLCMGIASAQVLSVSKIDFDSNDPTLRKSAFVLTQVENGGAQYAVFNIANLEQGLPSGYSLEGRGTIRSDITNYRLSFPIVAGKPIYTLQELGNKFSLITPEGWCYNDLNGIFLAKDLGFTNYYCYGWIVYGTHATISDGQHEFENKYTVSVQGKTPEIVTITQDNRVAQTSHVHVRYQGDLGGSQIIPRPDLQRDGFFRSNSWTMMRKLTSTEIQNQEFFGQGMMNFLSTCKDSRNNPRSCVTDWNQKIVTTTQPVSFTSATTQGTERTNGKLVLTPTQMYRYPVVTLTIDAEWVGVFRPVGKPVIVDIQHPSKFIEGEQNNIITIVRNDANIQASFDYSWSCEPQGVSVSTTQLIRFGANDERTNQHFVTGQTADGVTTVQCTLTVRDSENPSASDTKTFTMQVAPQNQCDIEGQQRCSINTIQQCVKVQGALVWSDVSDCLTSCRMRDTNFAECTENVNVAPICGDTVCHNLESNPSSIYYCPQDCILPPPVCGDGICDAREAIVGGKYECFQPKGDCPKPPTKLFSTAVIMWIVIVLGVVLVIGAVYLRLRKEGYLKK